MHSVLFSKKADKNMYFIFFYFCHGLFLELQCCRQAHNAKKLTLGHQRLRSTPFRKQLICLEEDEDIVIGDDTIQIT